MKKRVLAAVALVAACFLCWYAYSEYRHKKLSVQPVSWIVENPNFFNYLEKEGIKYQVRLHTPSLGHLTIEIHASSEGTSLECLDALGLFDGPDYVHCIVDLPLSERALMGTEDGP